MFWRRRRQIVAVLIVLLPTAGAGVWFFYSIVATPPSCVDNRKNQGETAVDCGGPCESCELKNPKPIVLHWARVVRVRKNSYDVAAEIENANEVLSSAKLDYEFVLRDDTVPIAVREGSTFLLAQEKTKVLEGNLSTTRDPTKVEFKIKSVKWEARKEFEPNILVEKREYKIEADDKGKKYSVVEAILINKTALSFRTVAVQIILLDENGNLVGVNKTIIENFRSGERTIVRLPWPEELPGEVVGVIVEPRVNLFDSTVILRP